MRAHVRAPVRGGGSLGDVGFRTYFNPPGFTYKRREKAAMKRRKGAMEEIVEAGRTRRGRVGVTDGGPQDSG